MSLLRFAHFTFDPLTLELCAHSEVVTLRPKTAGLLRELIIDRDRVLDKRQLITRVWHTEYVTDQSVFQAISELRRQLAPLNAIRTFPNRGYQWVLPVDEVSTKPRPVAVALAATVVLAVVGMVGIPGPGSLDGLSSNGSQLSQTPVSQLQDQDVQGRTSRNTSPSLPAMMAFSEGAAALQRGDTRQALDLLQLSVVERPDFVEARLLLAEAYLLHGDAAQARQRADNVMSSLTPHSTAYITIAAMDLLSRADQQLGQMNSALAWAARAADEANTSGYECTAADLQDRVLALVQDHDFSSALPEASPVFASDFARRMLRVASSAWAVAPAENGGSLAHSSSPAPDLVGGIMDQNHNDNGIGAESLQGLLGRAIVTERPAHCERYRHAPSGQLSPSQASERSLAYIERYGQLVKPLI